MNVVQALLQKKARIIPIKTSPWGSYLDPVDEETGSDYESIHPSSLNQNEAAGSSSRPRTDMVCEKVLSSTTSPSHPEVKSAADDGDCPQKPAPKPHLVRASSLDNEFDEHDDETAEWEGIAIDPNGNFYYYWTGLVALASFYTTAVIILCLSFPEMSDINYFTRIDYLCDIIYLLDICVHFRLAYLEEGLLVVDPDRLSEDYRSMSQFWKDVLAIFPLHTVLSIILRLANFFQPGVTSILRLNTYSALTRLPRLIKSYSIIKFFSLTDSRTHKPNLARAVKLCLYLWMVIHWIGCFYYAVSEYEGLGSNEWVYPSSNDSRAFSRKYILSTYWSMMTLTTIGERSPPETNLEYVFTGFSFLTGVFVFAAVVGNVGDVISNMNAARQEFQSRMDQIKFYMNHRNVKPSIQRRAVRLADYTWSRTQSINECDLLSMLPDRLRSEIAINVHFKTLKKVKIFEECEDGLLHELVLKLRPQIYSPRDYICRIDEIGREMYIINSGKVEILVPNQASGKKTVVATLSAGNYFGEISLLKLDGGQNRRTADVRSLGFSELLCLSRRDLISALVEYPDAKEILEAQARKRMKETQEVRRSSNPDATEKTASGDPPSPTADSAPPTAAAPAQPALPRKGSFANIVKSDMFQKLINVRGNELSEIKQIITELKMFDSQATKTKIKELSDKCNDLNKVLTERDEELCKAKQRITDLESKANRPRRRRSSAGKIPEKIPEPPKKMINGWAVLRNKVNPNRLDVRRPSGTDVDRRPSLADRLSPAISDEIDGVSDCENSSDRSSDKSSDKSGDRRKRKITVIRKDAPKTVPPNWNKIKNLFYVANTFASLIDKQTEIVKTKDNEQITTDNNLQAKPEPKPVSTSPWAKVKANMAKSTREQNISSTNTPFPSLQTSSVSAALLPDKTNLPSIPAADRHDDGAGHQGNVSSHSDHVANPDQTICDNRTSVVNSPYHSMSNGTTDVMATNGTTNSMATNGTTATMATKLHPMTNGNTSQHLENDNSTVNNFQRCVDIPAIRINNVTEQEHNAINSQLTAQAQNSVNQGPGEEELVTAALEAEMLRAMSNDSYLNSASEASDSDMNSSCVDSDDE